VIRIPIRWRDLDALGHVNHAVFLNYLEEVRDSWLIAETEGKLRREELVIARVEIDFQSPVTLQDGELEGECRLLGVGKRSLRTREALRRPNGEPVANSETTLVLWDPERSTSRAITGAERDLFSRVAGTMSQDRSVRRH
jgi:acyl-CoA thioester hydrolase